MRIVASKAQLHSRNEHRFDDQKDKARAGAAQARLHINKIFFIDADLFAQRAKDCLGLLTLCCADTGRGNPDNNAATTPEKVEKTYFVPFPVPEKYTEIKEPSKEELDALRKEGIRPSVVGCFINNKKLLLVYQKTFNLWQLPQGG